MLGVYGFRYHIDSRTRCTLILDKLVALGWLLYLNQMAVNEPVPFSKRAIGWFNFTKFKLSLVAIHILYLLVGSSTRRLRCSFFLTTYNIQVDLKIFIQMSFLHSTKLSLYKSYRLEETILTKLL